MRLTRSRLFVGARTSFARRGERIVKGRAIHIRWRRLRFGCQVLLKMSTLCWPLRDDETVTQRLKADFVEPRTQRVSQIVIVFMVLPLVRFGPSPVFLLLCHLTAHSTRGSLRFAFDVFA